MESAKGALGQLGAALDGVGGLVEANCQVRALWVVSVMVAVVTPKAGCDVYW